MFNLEELIKTAGYLGLAGIVFAESGLLVGFFLPGDSLLFTAGILASQHYLNIWWLMPILFVAAVVGDSVGYAFGRKMGPKIFKKEDSLFFHKDHILKAQAFFNKHGGKTIIIARFVPVVRTFAPIVAGVGSMTYSRFIAFNIVGGFLWAVGLTFLGYAAGKSIPNIDAYIIPIVLGIIILSAMPPVIHVLRDANQRKAIIGKLKSIIFRS